ncbi:MAG: PTS fructose transporter subunit IIA [Burkholderiaceae bacterium]|jgi:PTS system ascorbate-specific IIA component|nr:PTS fructose transporter subunit IIA [Burkholderiaceae bacterium]
MIGILLIMHEPLAQAFMAAAAHTFDRQQDRMEALDVKADQDVLEVCQLASQAISRLDDGSGVLVLTDVPGGTPSNCCRHLNTPEHFAVITGVSLPMLLRAITYRDGDLDTVVEKALSGGKNGAVRLETADHPPVGSRA